MGWKVENHEFSKDVVPMLMFHPLGKQSFEQLHSEMFGQTLYVDREVSFKHF